MMYKEFEGVAEYDKDSGIWARRVINLKDVVTFQGNSYEEAEQAFRDSVEDYLVWQLLEDGLKDGNPSGNRIIRNRIWCLKRGEIIESINVHDFKQCFCCACAVDGGRDYLRRIGERGVDWEDISEFV